MKYINPEMLINSYIWEQFKQYGTEYIQDFKIEDYSGITPFFPVSDTVSGDEAWLGKTYVIYDSMTNPHTIRRNFYPIKTGQLIYSIKGDIKDLFQWRDFITYVLDRDDQAAQDVNQFSNGEESKIYFHKISVFQFNTVNQKTTQSGVYKDFVTDLIIQFEYHRSEMFNTETTK